jgi:polar amino acid transport system permease protein
MVWDWDYSIEILPDLFRALGVTIQATLLGMLIALALGLVWAILRRLRNRWIAGTIHWAVEFIRSTPLLVQIYFIFFVLPEWGLTLSPFVAGVAALGLHYSAYTAEVYRAGIEGVPKGQWEAAMALNMGPWLTWRRVVLPQAIPPVIPALGNYFIAMFKDSPMLAAITVMELLQTAKLMGSETFRYLEPLTLVGLLFLAISLVASKGIRNLETRFANR